MEDAFAAAAGLPDAIKSMILSATLQLQGGTTASTGHVATPAPNHEPRATGTTQLSPAVLKLAAKLAVVDGFLSESALEVGADSDDGADVRGQTPPFSYQAAQTAARLLLEKQGKQAGLGGADAHEKWTSQAVRCPS
jgi:hypothetical protein